MDLLTLDFETFYSTEFSLTKLTTEAYIRDPRFEVIGVATKVNDEPTQWVTGSKEHIQAWLEQFDWSNTALLAHNTMFDAGILSFIFNIHPKRMLDTMSMARAALGVDVSVSLANLSKHYHAGEKGTEVLQALGKRRADFTPAQLKAYGGYCINDVDLTHYIYTTMINDGFPLGELKLIDLTLRTFTQPKLLLNADLLRKHLSEVQDKKTQHIINTLKAAGREDVAAVAMVSGVLHAEVQKTLRSNDQFAELLRYLNVDPPTKTSPTTGKKVWAFAKTDKAFKDLQEHEDTRVQAVVAARLGVKTTIEESRTERFIEMSARGVFPIPLKYAGARTFRWSGSDKLNLQNLPSRGDTTLKQAIYAPEGYVIVGADLSNIELRVGLWLAGQMDKLEALGKGMDLYKDFASKVFNVPYDEVTKEQRFIGKTSQLSLIYGVGAAKLRSAIQVGSGTDIGESEAKRIVDLYRTQYHHVKAAWDSGEDCLKAILHNTPRSYGRANLIRVDGNKGCRLPSDLYLRYPELKTIQEEGKRKWVYHTRKGREYLYGAKFFQGLVQSIARCVMGEQMVQIAREYPIVLTVHDAVYILATQEDADTAMAFVLAKMRTAPQWMSDIPLDAEAAYGTNLAQC